MYRKGGDGYNVNKFNPHPLVGLTPITFNTVKCYENLALLMMTEVSLSPLPVFIQYLTVYTHRITELAIDTWLWLTWFFMIQDVFKLLSMAGARLKLAPKLEPAPYMYRYMC